MASSLHARNLLPTKAERSSGALRAAELAHKWYSAAELYEAAASIWPTGALNTSTSDVEKLLRKAEQCRLQISQAQSQPEDPGSACDCSALPAARIRMIV